jgi:carboxymethylenebutenolidase
MRTQAQIQFKHGAFEPRVLSGKLKPKTKSEYAVTPGRAESCIVVFHEVWGLVDHTKDVCKRLGKLGFAAVAPNLYSGYEILTPRNIQKAMEGVWELSLEERRNRTKVASALESKGVSQDIKEVAGIIYNPVFRDKLLETALAAVERAHANFEAVATLGFCLGGGLSFKCAAMSTSLKSAIGFYGEPPVAEVGKISIPVLALFAYQDEIINRKVPAFVGAMLEGGKDLMLKTYPHTKHGFFNEARKAVYNREAAREAWDVTKWFLERTL